MFYTILGNNLANLKYLNFLLTHYTEQNKFV